MALPLCAEGWSAVRGRGNSCSYTLTFWMYIAKGGLAWVRITALNSLPLSYMQKSNKLCSVFLQFMHFFIATLNLSFNLIVLCC